MPCYEHLLRVLWGTETKEFMIAFCTQVLTCGGDLFMLLNHELHSAGLFLLNGKSTSETVDCHFFRRVRQICCTQISLYLCANVFVQHIELAYLLHKLFSISMCVIGSKFSIFGSNWVCWLVMISQHFYNIFIFYLDVAWFKWFWLHS